MDAFWQPAFVVFFAIGLLAALLAWSIALAIYMMVVTTREIVGDVADWVKRRMQQHRYRHVPPTGLELLIKNAQDRLRTK